MHIIPPTGITSFEYDDSGRITRQNNGNGTHTVYHYDTAGRLDQVTSYNTNTNGVLSSFIYTLDLAGNTTQVVESVVPAGGGTAQSATTAYAYEGSGNRLTVKNGSDVTLKSYTYDDGNKLLTEVVS